MNGAGVQIWGWNGTVWDKVLIDATGHLQVDVITAGGTASHCMGWDSANWQPLPLEGIGLHNLRVKLYDGANGIDSFASHDAIGEVLRALIVTSELRAWDDTNWIYLKALRDPGDNVTVATNALATVAFLYGFDGASWDRLRTGTPADAFATPTHALRVISFLMGYDGGDWNRVRVDDAGHLQTDVLSVPTTDVNCHGYDGAAWQTLLVESNVLHNLRVKLYDGANGIDSDLFSTLSVLEAKRALHVQAAIRLYDSAASVLFRWYNAKSTGDGHTGSVFPAVALMGYNGATWDRLRTWGTGILKVGRAEIDSTTVRKTAAGAVVAGAHNLYWVACSPDAPGAEFELTDAIAGGGAIVFDHFDPDKHSEVIHLDPPMKFATGIWVEKFDHIHSLVFCYV